MTSLKHIVDRMTEAYEESPYGKWIERWIPGMCRHRVIRCTHGDEISARKFRRRVCMICGRSLNGPLPENCFFTGEPHNKGG